MARRQLQRFRVSITGHPDHPQPHSYEVEAHSANEAVRNNRFSSYLSVYPSIPANGTTTVGVPYRYKSSIQVSLTVEVECLGAVGRKKYTPEERVERAAARRAAEAVKEAKRQQRKEEQRRHTLAVRKRIVNQIELAFEKKMKTATDFVTCDGWNCQELADRILTSRPPEGTTVPFDDIIGARCAAHYNVWNKEPFVACNRIEFFFDGLRQLHINKAA